MSDIKDEINNDDIKFAKGVQLSTTYYTLLLFFAIIALFKIPGRDLTEIVPWTYCIVVLITIFSLIYQIHTAISLWQYRDRLKINYTSKKVLLPIYTIFHIVLILLTAFITYTIISSITITSR